MPGSRELAAFIAHQDRHAPPVDRHTFDNTKHTHTYTAPSLLSLLPFFGSLLRSLFRGNLCQQLLFALHPYREVVLLFDAFRNKADHAERVVGEAVNERLRREETRRLFALDFALLTSIAWSREWDGRE